MIWLLFSLFFFFSFSIFEEYEGNIDWTKVSTSSTEELESMERDSDFGSCVCDLTFGQCDFNCECDSDCSSEERSLFSGDLKPEVSRVNKETKCFAIDSVFDNLPTSVNKKEENRSPYGICVLYETNPSLGTFFDYIGDASLNSIENAKKKYYENYEYGAKSETDESTSLDTNKNRPYAHGDFIPVQRVNGTSSSGYLSIPVSVSSQCTDDAGLPSFMNQMIDQTCSRDISDPQKLSNLCLTSFNPLMFVDDITFSTVANEISGSWGPITIRYINGQTGGSTTTAIYSSASSTVANCSSAMTELRYTVVYNSYSFLSAIYADIVIKDIDTTMKTIDQTFSVFFTDENPPDGTWDGSTREKSGNPGYLQRSSVLAGRRISNGAGLNAIIQRVNGWELPSGMMMCDDIVNALSSGNEDDLIESQVLFHEDVITSCKMTFSDSADLQSFCVTGAMDPYLTLENVTYIGKYGNSDLNNINEWIQILEETNDEIITWDATTSSCLKVPSMVNFDVLITRTGPLRNAQWKIVGVKKSYSVSTWKIPVANADFSFYLKYRINFIEDVDGANYPTMTPMKSFVSVPNDWFYPLTMLIGESAQSFPIDRKVLGIIFFLITSLYWIG